MEFVASKEKSQTGRGQMQDQGASFTREKTLAPIRNAGVPNASAAPGDWQTRKVSAEPITPHSGMSTAPSAAFPGGSTSPRPSSVAVKTGNAKQ
jgi:hypothetical protein